MKAKLIALAIFIMAGLISPHGRAAPTLSGLWWNSSESGWGVAFEHQQPLVFATFYIYDGSGKPFWVVAELNDVAGTQKTFSGPLYNATGTPYSRVPFLASDTKGIVLGSATLNVVDTYTSNITYTINGSRVTKVVQRQATKAINPSGVYDGGSPTYTVALSSGSNSISVTKSVFIDSLTCIYSGTVSQYGARLVVSGTYRCSNLKDGNWSTEDLQLQDGVNLLATVFTRENGATQFVSERWFGTKSGGNALLSEYTMDRKATPSLTGLWWNPDESGWGVAFDHQASLVFATMYIYDENGKPYWLVAELNSTNTAQTAFSGPVYNATGSPYSQTPFLASETKGVVLGTATLAITDANHAVLIYTVNGFRAEKQVQRQTLKAVNLVGKYQGVVTPSTFGVDSFNATISQSGNILIIDSDGFQSPTCKYQGAPVQLGQRMTVSGTYRCGLVDGTWTTDDMTIVDGLMLSASIQRLQTGARTPYLERWAVLKTQ